MNHEKIFVKDNGDKISVRVYFHSDCKGGNYRLGLMYCPKGKRKYINVIFDGYQYRQLSIEERMGYEYNTFLNYVTAEQIMQAKLELWEKLKPL